LKDVRNGGLPRTVETAILIIYLAADRRHQQRLAKALVRGNQRGIDDVLRLGERTSGREEHHVKVR